MTESKKFRNTILTETPSSPPTHNKKRETQPTQVHTPTLVSPSKLNQEGYPKNCKKERSHRASRRQLSFHRIDEEEREISEELPISPVTESSIFGGRNSSMNDHCQTNTRRVYTLVNKMTGSIGGNGHGGAIYGELTVGSMQKMIDLMKIHTNFGKDSRFIDVGSGLGKPNLHVTQDPGVEFSYGIEMEHVRWMLGMSNLKTVLEEAHNQGKGSKTLLPEEKIHHGCIFAHGDITDAKYFDPFTHVYMFDIGFPPKLFKQLAEMFNRSQSEYLICYHGPKSMIEKYGFDVVLIVQTPTSMHGSSECHMGYIYRRSNTTTKPLSAKELPIVNGVPCDPLFQSAWEFVKQDTASMLAHVKNQLLDSLNSQRPKRKRS